MTRGGGLHIEITGTDVLVAKLVELVRRTSDQYQAFGEIADVMKTEARSRVPVRSGQLAGSLANSHGRRVAEASAGGGRTQYAAPIEYGWRRRHIEPHSYLVAGADAAEDDAVRILDGDIDKQIRFLGL